MGDLPSTRVADRQFTWRDDPVGGGRKTAALVIVAPVQASCGALMASGCGSEPPLVLVEHQKYRQLINPGGMTSQNLRRLVGSALISTLLVVVADLWIFLFYS
ncbi:hypothetical protein [Umezawaea beigongshangensis]|uniref:hypothetical protein n=1 Tax=Umezawaea beigongshangensis TaxID=2780383 RepID=UPI0018F234E9|nr:hypothetical protein [Umezawaea beigongshangensis]